jgi:hypothetical protein
MKKLIARLSALALVGVAGMMLANAARAAGGGSNCPDIYDPVICSNGVVYPNGCYARLAKAKNCVPYGDD